MNFFGRSNNGNGVNVNTNLYTSTSDTCMVKMGAWNNNLSIKFYPFKGVNADGIRQYAQDNSEVVSTALNTDNATALLQAIKTELTPAIEAHEPKVISVAMGNQNDRKVMSLKYDGGTVMKLCIATAVDENGVAQPVNIIEHTFNVREYMVGYDPDTGAGEKVTVMSDYLNFVEKVKDIYKLSAAVSHSINYSNALKSSFTTSRNQANNNAPQQDSMNAPITNYGSGEEMDFLPFN